MGRVQGCVSLVKRWLPAVIWMIVIFSASSDSKSSHHSSRIIEPILLWLNPNLDRTTVVEIVVAVRKTAHVIEYAILGCLCWLGCQPRPASGRRPWRWSHAAIAFGIAVAYAFTDEFHQSFVPSRTGHLADVLIDSAGAAGGLLLLWTQGRWRKHW